MKRVFKMAIDLLWVKHNKVGGVESCIRNILDGLMELDEEYHIYLLVSRDNADSFSEYERDRRFKLVRCNVQSEKVAKRIIWQNMYLGKTLKRCSVDICFEPHNYIPLLGVNDIKFITTIHDLQPEHYPEYFSKKKVLWYKLNWKNTLKHAEKIIAISNFVKEDINNCFPGFSKKIKVIYDPIYVNKDCANTDEILKKYGIEKKNYYYTVSSMQPHKNLDTIVRVIYEINKRHIDLPQKLLISGIGGDLKGDLEKKLERYGIENNVIITGFVSNEERNTLYQNCRAFLFPSVFEGFGMPPIEAMMLGVPVITTRKSCLEEVTRGEAEYVNDPYSIDEWIKIMKKTKDNYATEKDFPEYQRTKIAKDYYNSFIELDE
ncbi:Glycosyltransferase involved in cell wall bisynthesis [Lachnospiraceae bacterium NE2001]|nr:Glycosyltransferase involved in cell wall bisynthesis [Lachnospiraceae bacterium NE2001]